MYALHFRQFFRRHAISRRGAFHDLRSSVRRKKIGKAPPESRLLPDFLPTIKTPSLYPVFTGPIFTLDRIIEIGTILPLEKRLLSGRQAIAGGIAGVIESAFVKVNV
jgi:hypothetical protein